MRRLKQVFQLALGIALLTAAGYGIWHLAREFYVALSDASAEVSAAVIGSMATVLVSIAVVLINQRSERRRASDEAHRLKKVEMYKGFIGMVSKLIGSKNKNLSIKEPTQRELVDFAFKFKTEMMLWGSPQVIKAFIAFEEASSENPKALFQAINELYKAIRSDIGLSNFGFI